MVELGVLPAEGRVSPGGWRAFTLTYAAWKRERIDSLTYSIANKSSMLFLAFLIFFFFEKMVIKCVGFKEQRGAFSRQSPSPSGVSQSSGHSPSTSACSVNPICLEKQAGATLSSDPSSRAPFTRWVAAGNAGRPVRCTHRCSFCLQALLL